jgi:two-component system chemotaxis response regulator CheY
MNQSNRKVVMTPIWQGKTVLVVDDSIQEQEKLKKVFNHLGLEVIGTAEDGLSAIEKYAHLQPDLVSLDIIMPEMHGIDCYKKLKETYTVLNVLFISCLGRDPSVVEALSKQIDTALILAKPAKIEDVSQALKIIFEHNSLASAAIKT